MDRGEFIKIAKELYGDRYDYSLVTEEGVKYESNVPIKCLKHGIFFTTPYQFLYGMVGCYECFVEEQQDIKKEG